MTPARRSWLKDLPPFGWIGQYRRLSRSVRQAEERSGEGGGGTVLERAIRAIDMAGDQPGIDTRRMQQLHAVSGLPTREPLAARMTADGSGTLALLACKDYDRLCAFDPLMAERLLLAVVDRLAVMLPQGRFLAQVDRSHLAVWIGPEIGPDAAAAEVAALVYALGDRLVDGDRDILPEVVSRSAVFDSALAPPQAVLSQTLAAFAVSPIADGAAATTTLALGAHARERYLVEQDLRQAAARGELHLQYQPLIDAAAGRVCGAEALLRWRHPERGLVSPARFVPLMEAAGLASEIGLWALNHAVREAKSWSVAGRDDMRVAVNVSGSQLADDLPLLVERTLARHALPAEALEVELTESVALADGDGTAGLCDALRRLGVRIAIDDFGTGYSSFGALRALPFDKIKIDRTFVSGVDLRRDGQAICAAILALGRGLGIRVLAEGVETAGEYAWLRAQGCRYFQGYYFSRPLDGDAFLRFSADDEALLRLLSPERPRPAIERLRA